LPLQHTRKANAVKARKEQGVHMVLRAESGGALLEPAGRKELFSQMNDHLVVLDGKYKFTIFDHRRLSE
tara:strand:- start:47 stop:253 length:207 start_codon:yes stop_codon:yes gene_type:complete